MKGHVGHETNIICIISILALQAQATNNPNHRVGANARSHGEDNLLPTASGPTSKHDEAMNVKLLLKEICQLLGMKK